MKKVWFTADHHFGHERILELAGRPFSTVDEMNRTMIERHNDLVGDDDIVWILGDVAMGHIAETMPLVGQLRGHKYLIAGNHDRCFAGEQKDPGRLERWTKFYVEVGGFTAVVTGSGWLANPNHRRPIVIPHLGGALDTPVILSHFPYAGESDPDRPDRFARSRPVRPKVEPGRPKPWLLHGHVHEQWCMNDDQINVGVDVWDFAPVDVETLVALIQGSQQ